MITTHSRLHFSLKKVISDQVFPTKFRGFHGLNDHSRPSFPPIPSDMLILHPSEPAEDSSPPFHSRDIEMADLAGSPPATISGHHGLALHAPSAVIGSETSLSSAPSSAEASSDAGFSGSGKKAESVVLSASAATIPISQASCYSFTKGY